MKTQKFTDALSLLIAVALSLAHAKSFAEELDAASQDALRKTIELMNSPELRGAAIQDPKAKAADKAVGVVSGGNADLKNDIYSLSSIVFERIVSQSGGDTQKMNQLLMDAQRDPASFAAKFFPPGSPEAAKLKELEARATPGLSPPPVRRVKP